MNLSECQKEGKKTGISDYLKSHRLRRQPGLYDRINNHSWSAALEPAVFPLTHTDQYR